MELKTYPNATSLDGSYTAEEIRCGLHWVNTDVTCPICGKVQPVTATHYIGGPCVRCGALTSGDLPKKD